MVRQGLRSFLETYPNIEVVGEATDGEEAVRKAVTLQPTVVVMDISMPKMDGIAATRLIKMNYPRIAVVGLSAEERGYEVEAMLKAGAFETLMKDRAASELYSAIQRAVASLQPIFVLHEKAPSTEPASGITERPSASDEQAKEVEGGHNPSQGSESSTEG